MVWRMDGREGRRSNKRQMEEMKLWEEVGKD